jgi:hypothetical protein
MLSQAAILETPDASCLPPSRPSGNADLPEWFTLRGHAGVFRVDRVRSRGDVIVVANGSGREVGRCSLSELRESIYKPA